MDVGRRIRIGMAAGVAATAAAAIALAGSVQAGPPALLPDLETVNPGPHALDLRVGEKQKRVILRVSNIVANSGAGPMEVYPSRATKTGGPGGDTDCTEGEFEEPVGADRDANQRIYEDTDGNGFDPGDEVGEETKIGCFEYHQHPAHNHWHLQDFAQFRLLNEDGDPIPDIEPSRKIGFCVFDNQRSFPDLGSDEPGYNDPTCNQGNPADGPEGMGLSVGWGDLYSYTLPGQRIDITGVTRGTYCLVSVANPPDPPNPPPFRSEIVELDETNNERRKLVRINPNRDKAVFRDGTC